MKSITILGSTGSIGTQTVELIIDQPEEFQTHALVAKNNVDLLILQAKQTNAKIAVIENQVLYYKLKSGLSGTNTVALTGIEGCITVASEKSDLVISAIPGIAGLVPTVSAYTHNKVIALANKEALVCAGNIIKSNSTTQIIPLDSEHNAIFQLYNKGIANLTITGSGGPFYKKPKVNCTPAKALNHPIWCMGEKISIDSATQMNKVLEVFEAESLFNVDKSRIKILVHPQAIVHGMVSYNDGNTIAVLYNPDMKIPISYALTWPKRGLSHSCVDLAQVTNLSFYEYDTIETPAIELLKSNQYITINAANEVAVTSFLNNEIPFLSIVPLIHATLENYHYDHTDSVDSIIECDKEARIIAQEQMNRLHKKEIFLYK